MAMNQEYMSSLPPRPNQVSPIAPSAPYQEKLDTHTSASPSPSPFSTQGQSPQTYSEPQQGPPFGQNQPGPYGPAPGKAGYSPVSQYGAQQGQFPPAGLQPSVSYGMLPAYGAPIPYGMPPYMMPNLVQPDQLKGKDYSCLVKCPQCQASVMSNVKTESNMILNALYIIFLVIGIFFWPLLIVGVVLAFFTTYQIHECSRCQYKLSSENKSCPC